MFVALRFIFNLTALTLLKQVKNYFTEVLSFFFKPLFCVNSGPGMQLTTAAMPPAQDDVAFGLLNSRGQAARWTSVPVHATEWMRKWFF